MSCLGLIKTRNQNTSVLNGSRSILGFVWITFHSDFGLGLVLMNFSIKEMLEF